MKCIYCNVQMAHANMSGTDHCLNPECLQTKRVLPITDAERITRLEAKVQDLTAGMAALKHYVDRLRADHGRC